MPRTPVAGVARSVPVTTKMTAREAAETADQAVIRGFTDRSAYIRWLVKRDGSKIAREGVAREA